MIKLGQVYTDKITGFKGVATARTEFMHGCARISLQAQELHEGKVVPTEVFDELQLVEYVAKPGEIVKGGPKDIPTRALAPTR